MYAFGDFELRAESCELLRSGRPTDLQLIPTRLLLYLLENRERAVPKTELLDEIWPDTHVSESAFTTAVGRLRQQLGDDGATQRFIRARRGRGYQFVAEVEERFQTEATPRREEPPALSDGDPILREGSPDRIVRPNRFGLRTAQRGAVAVLLALLALVWWYGRAPTGSVRALAFEERDWVLVAAFENHAGEVLFDGTLEAALARELGNSRFVNVVPRERIQDTLRLMKKPLDTRVDSEVGREICLRDGGIRALLTGRVDKLGSAYLLSVELVDPTEGLTVASLSETAQGEDQVLSALHRLATSTRETLGEEIQQLRVSDEEFETVSTTSLRALQLFSQADAAIARQKNDVAEVLLKQAIVEDREFASAYNHLAHSLRNQRRPQEEFIPYARRALELSEPLPERERYFIEGSYFSFLGQYDQEILSYEALLQLHPDHYWANNNMAAMLQLVGRAEEAIPYFVRRAELRPHDFRVNVQAGWQVALSGDSSQAALLFGKAVELLPPLSDPPPTPNGARAVAATLLYPTQDLWLRGDLERLVTELERWEERLPSMHPDLRKGVAWYLSLGYWSVGQTRTDLGVFTMSDEGDRTLRALAIASAQDDLTLLRETLQEESTDMSACWIDNTWCVPLASRRVQLLAQAGLLAEAREALAQFEALDGAPWLYKESVLLVLRGELALAEGHTDAAISLLEAGLPLERSRFSFIHLPGSISLSSALLERGERTRALGVLQETSELKSRTYVNRWQWVNAQVVLADRYRELGYEAEAREIEEELLGLMAYADPDFPLLLRLQGISNSAIQDSG